MELDLIDIGQLLIIGILASALNWAVVDGMKKVGLFSKSGRRLAPTAVGLLLTAPGLPLALVWLTPLTWDELTDVRLWLAPFVLTGAVANAGGAQWCHAIIKTVLERLGDRAPDLLTKD